MKNLLLLFFFLFIAQLFAQHNSITTEDFNSDGIEDILMCSYEIGSNFGGADCELTDGKTKKKFTLTNYGCFCAIKKRVSVLPELRKKENEYFFYNLKKEVLPKFRPTPDQSLFWIINSSLNTQKQEENQYFNLTFNPKTVWRQEEPELPSTYYIEMGARTLSKIIRQEKITYAKSESSDQKDFLIYYGDTHFSSEGGKTKAFIPVEKNESYEILKTDHGVIAKKGNKYKWVFVTDMDINASPQKLRWASIEEVVLHDNHVIIKQALAPDPKYNIYVIEIETGLGGRLKIDFDFLLERGIEIPDLKPEERFSITDDMIVIGKKRNKMKFPLTEIKQELEILIKGN
ncbi:hypothetical protein FEE95_03720 [Maribacter algarum]|uniref:Uncharacterized protein n=1 Tax=Maribacter algarum (ex Zhang et al. 2020) TaxID=2578118 RepID=A0A5S3PUC9_9FLAO|nr:hypothetical protein [Maribacter algarum]TMM58550.1 hypothetical protein FEE95_03720 [Maribacter algarum]